MQNLVILVGTVIKSEAKQYKPGKYVINLQVQTEKNVKDQVYKAVHRVVQFSNNASAPMMGEIVYVEGDLRNRSYENRGQKVWVTEVMAEKLTSFSQPQENHEQAFVQKNVQAQKSQAPQRQQPPMDEPPFNDQELPF